MGYGIMPYRVSLAKVESCIGTNDEGLKKKIIADSEERLNDLSEEFEDGDETAFSEIMQDLLNGEINHEDEAYKYWYAIEAIVMIMGKSLDNGAWYPFDVAISLYLEGIKSYGLETKLDIPWPDDFPAVFVIRNHDLELAEQSIKETLEDSDMVKQFSEWVSQAGNTNEDLILFLY